MENSKRLEDVERYLLGEMPREERTAFERLRQSDPALDQLIVEQSILLKNLDDYRDRKNFTARLSATHQMLKDGHKIQDDHKPSPVITLWRKYKRVMAVAASIAGLTTFLVAGMVSYYSRKENTQTVLELNRKFENTRRTVDALKQRVEQENIAKAPDNTPIKSGGTGFLIDGKGYLITNAHVVQGATTIVVQNNKGQDFRAELVHKNPMADIAVLRIIDNDFKPLSSLPYGIKRAGAELGEQLFTLGYPREEIVYNEGYMSAKTGFKGDTISFQIGVTANPGNSGGPVFNKHGEIIGIINTRQEKAEGVVFAISSQNIFHSLQQIESDSIARKLRLPTSSNLRGMERTQQIRKIEECVFMIKSY